jgi:KTSC domain
MDRVSVTSSDLVSVGYDITTNTLEIEFKENRIYQYYNVPESEYEGLMSAASHGQYFHANINGQYAYKEI